ncbi:MAG: sulfatase-like hydrolase/transferase [Burkholderiaceae bacterium]
MKRRDVLHLGVLGMLSGCSGGQDTAVDSTLAVGSSDPASPKRSVPSTGPTANPLLQTKGRNILLVLADEMRFPMHFPGDPGLPDSVSNVLSATTYLQRFMPNLWRIRASAVSFEQHHSAATACTPARTSLMTGLYAHQHNVLATLLPAQESTGSVPLIPVLSPQFPTLGTVLTQMGYISTYIGKWHMSYPASHGNSIAAYGAPDFNNLQHLFANGYLGPYGFLGGTYPDPEGGAPSTGELLDPQICAGFTQWNQTIRGTLNQPWFTVVSLVEPHDAQFFWDGVQDNPFKPSAAYPNSTEQVAKYAPQGAVNALYAGPPANLENYASTFRDSIFSLFRSAQANDFINGAISHDSAQTQMALVLSDPPPSASNAPLYTTIAPYGYWQKTLDYYAYLHTVLDGSIGKILAEVDAMPAAQRPLIVFTADHGEYAGAHGLRGKGYTGFRESTQVPLYVYDPNGSAGFAAGTRQIMTSSVDVLPLIGSLAAGESVAWIQANSTYAGLWSSRLKLYDSLYNSGAPGRSYVLHSYDEPAVQTDMQGNPTAYHMVAYRTPTYLICGYSLWDEQTQQIDSASTQYTAFDLSGSTGALELTKMTATAQQINALKRAIASELRAPLPSTQQSASKQANAQRVLYTQSKIADSVPGQIWDTVDW